VRISHPVVLSVEPVVTDDEWVYDLEVEDTHCYFAEGVLVSNCHEAKSDSSAQSMAAGKLMAGVPHILALTGTIIGGYADHLFPLMMRICPTTLRDEGFEWGKDLPFSEVYGRIDRIVTVREETETSVRGNVKSMRRARTGNASERKAVRPGVMPTLFGRHLIGNAMFITLEELADELPDLFEYIGGPLPEPGPDEDPERFQRHKDSYFDVACTMTPAQEEEYRRIAATLEFANKELLRRGSMKLLGAMLWTLLDYPDKPFGWGHDPEVKTAFAQQQAEQGPEAATRLLPPHTVGYWDKPGIRTLDNFVGVVTPRDLDPTVVYPKEQALIDICKKQKKDGVQTWVYVNMTGKRNIQPRLKMLLEREGLRIGILRADDVEPIEREAWIARHGREFDVMISHPQLVSTGLDLFSKAPGGHNYSTIVFYETGYNLFTMRQAARRAWRIGQPRDCRVYYLYYRETMQHKAMSLMSRKMAAAQALEGEFSEDGLAAMAGEDNLQMALARNLAERIDDADMQRSWGKIQSGPKKRQAVPGDALVTAGKAIPPSPLDELPIEVQMVVETMIDNQDKPVPPEAEAEFPGLAERLAQVDAGFEALPRDDESEDQDYEPEPEPVVLAFPAPDPVDAFVAKTVSECTDNLSVKDEAPVDEYDGSEDLEEEESDADDFFDDDDSGEEDDEQTARYKAMLTPDVMEKMLANKRANGIVV
jgi:hypothetical protein